jgi:REP-associated tyrosine transposase
MLAWPHAPTHHFPGPGTYMITAATYQKLPYFSSASRLSLLCNALLNIATSQNWQIEALAVFPNHYHVIAKPPAKAKVASQLGYLHSLTAKEVNRLDATRSRRVWFQFWDTELSFERSYFARLNYVHTNPVRHGVVRESTNYPWCSAGWFKLRAAPSFHKVVSSFRADRLKISDDYPIDPSTIS